MNNLHKVSFMLVIIGALNWGFVGLMDFNLVESLLGEYETLVQVVYMLVGLAGVNLSLSHKDLCTECANMDK
jgi:uncharacterized membrane protein YuzA (DUF378 family)